MVLLPLLFICVLLHSSSCENTVNRLPEQAEEYCQSEVFHPRCLKNEVILMRTAVYGRMQIGKCISKKEIDEHRSVAGDDSRIDPRILGCSVEILPFLDSKCSGKTECHVRIVDISSDNYQPCLTGLNKYIEASYDCIAVANEERSCSVVVSKSPVHIIGSANSKKICGTTSNPWIIEAPIGQNINTTLFSFNHDGKSRSASQPCLSRGVIVDKSSKKNTSICLGGKERQAHLSSSSANKLEIYTAAFKTPVDIDDNGDVEFIVKLEEHLFEKHDPKVQLDATKSLSDSEQVLAIVGICGFTLAICLAVGSVGLICLRRYHNLSKKNQNYKSLTFTTGTARSHRLDGQIVLGQVEYNQNFTTNSQQEPFYSVYAGRQSINETDGVIGIANKHNAL